MQKLSERLRSLEGSPFFNGIRPDGMRDKDFAHFIADMGDRERTAFISALSDADLQASIAFLKTLLPHSFNPEASHAA